MGAMITASHNKTPLGPSYERGLSSRSSDLLLSPSSNAEDLTSFLRAGEHREPTSPQGRRLFRLRTCPQENRLTSVQRFTNQRRGSMEVTKCDAC